MQRIAEFFSALRSLGIFGVILLLTAILIGWSVLSFGTLREPFLIAQAQIVKLNILEDEANYYLLELRTSEAHYRLSQGGDTHLQDYNDAAVAFLETLDALDAESVLYSPDELDLLDAMEKTRAQQDMTFQALSTAITAGDRPEIERLHQDYLFQANVMDQKLEEMIFLVKITRQDALEDLSKRSQQVILASVASLILLPLLALWAFSVAGQITQPILTLTNAVVAIEGNQFHPEVLIDTIQRRDALGPLAQDLERLAQTLSVREDALEQEIKDLREQLHESRRRRQLPTSPRRSDRESHEDLV